MTRKDLLAKIEIRIADFCDDVKDFCDVCSPWKALRAVVELHKPINNPNHPNVDEWCWQCADGRGYAKYPCPTIQAIEKELL